MADVRLSKKRKKNKGDDGETVIKFSNGKKLDLSGFLKPKATVAMTTDASASGAAVEPAAAPAPAVGRSVTRGPGSKRGSGQVAPEIGDAALLPVRQALPIWEYRDEIRQRLRESDVLVMVGETGSGKSTQVPQFLASEKWCRRRYVTLRTPNGREEFKPVGGVIAITQPRRVAATTLARRVAREAGAPLNAWRPGRENAEDTGRGGGLGNKAAAAPGRHKQPGGGSGQGGGPGIGDTLVGYSVRFDHNVPKGVKIKFLTEGMLLQEMLYDPNLKQYSAVIVDEVHERSIDVDLLCGFLKRILSSPDKAGRGGVPLKVVAMSATANIERLQEFFGTPSPTPLPSSELAQTTTTATPADTTTTEAKSHETQAQAQEQPQEQSPSTVPAPLLKIQGRQFPVEIIYSPQPVPDIAEAALKTVFKIHCGEPLPGDILVFLYGQEQIETVQRMIEEYAATLGSDVPRLRVFPLYGKLPIEAQEAAFRPLRAASGAGGGRHGVRKVVLATNIAETSVTVPGVRHVVDGGKAKIKMFRAQLGLESLLTAEISKSSAVQRAGRAGREAPGKCHRLYTEASFEELRDDDPPEIRRNDVLDAMLVLKARGVDDLFSFPLMDRPNTLHIEKALVQMHILGALDDDVNITPLGRQMARLPVSALLGRVLAAAADPAFDCLLEAIDIISCISAGGELFDQLRQQRTEEEAVVIENDRSKEEEKEEVKGETKEAEGSTEKKTRKEKRKERKGKKERQAEKEVKDAREREERKKKKTGPAADYGDYGDDDDDAAEQAEDRTAELRRELTRPREGDLLTYLTLMQRYTAEQSDRTQWCRARRVNARAMRSALNVRRQLRQLCLSEGMLRERPDPDPQPFEPCSPERAESITKCFLKGFVLKTARLSPDASYVTTQGNHVVAIHPSSVLHGRRVEAIMFLDHVFTQKSYAKGVAVIRTDWIAEVLEGKW